MSQTIYTDKQYKLAWDLTVELRKEIVESQKIRSQILGVKVAFISTGIGLIFANLSTVPIQLLAIPAFAALFFDFIINSYSFSIKGIGIYCKEHTEPILRQFSQWPLDSLLWEEYLCQPGRRTPLHVFGNVGITTMVVLVGLGAIATVEITALSVLTIAAIVVLTCFATYEFIMINKRA